MRTYIIRRLLLTFPVIFLVITLVFVAVRALPGDYAIQQLAQQFAQGSDDEREAIRTFRARLGIDKPVHEQYVIYLRELFSGNFGTSFRTGNPVIEEVRDRLPWTLQLATMTLLVAIIVSVPIGIISAIRQDSWIDYGLRSFAILFLAVPNFWLATMLIYLFSRFDIMEIPFTDSRLLWDDPAKSLRLFLVPAIAGGIAVGAGNMRLLRAQMLEVLRQDYVRTAWAKGLRERTVVMRHALKNALIPTLSVLGLLIAGLIGGQIILEVLFRIPGLGQYTFQAIVQRDYPVVQMVVLFISSFVVFVNLAVDVMYAWVDPRIRYQ